MSSAPVLLVELFIDAAWVDVTADVYEGTVSITRGRSDADSQAAPQSMHLTFKNDAGKYSPRNPLSPYFGKIGRNTRIRATVSTSSRFYGEVAAWEPTWDETHRIKTVPIVANGITRRMGQGSAPASVALRDYLLSLTQKPATYYPLSGASGTTYSLNVGEQFPGVRFYSTTGTPYAYGTELADWLGTGMTLDDTGATGYMEGQSGASGANVAFDFVYQSTNLGVLDVRLFVTSDRYWNLRINTAADAGTMLITYYDDSVGLLTGTASAAIPALQDGGVHHVRFELTTIAGPVVTAQAYVDGTLWLGDGFGTAPPSQSGLYLFRLFYSRTGAQAPVTLSHLAAWAEANSADLPSASSNYLASAGYAGEKAADRITRIAALAGTTATIVGTAAKTVAMGPQVAETRLSQLNDAEATDFGILCESRSSFALRYRTRESMYNQSPVAVIDYAALQMAVPFQPVDDDQQTRNDVTASRRGGDDYRIVKTTGPLSIQDPPNGVGPYQDSITVNVQTDAQLPGEAAWWLNLGTLDEARFPQVTLNLASTAIDNGKATTIRALDVGDLLQVINLAGTGTDIYSDVSLIVLGYTETIGDLQHVVTFNCAPAAPYTVGKYSDVTRYDTAGSELASSATSTATTLSVNNTGSTIWSRTFTGLLYLNVGGEKIRVTAISGTSNPQTFTVVRSQNSVVKAHASGTKVRLWDTPRYAL